MPTKTDLVLGVGEKYKFINNFAGDFTVTIFFEFAIKFNIYKKVIRENLHTIILFLPFFVRDCLSSKYYSLFQVYEVQ